MPTEIQKRIEYAVTNGYGYTPIGEERISKEEKIGYIMAFTVEDCDRGLERVLIKDLIQRERGGAELFGHWRMPYRARLTNAEKKALRVDRLNEVP